MTKPSQMSQARLNYFPEDDGYTIPTYYKAVPQIHGEVRFRFRPVEILERAALIGFKDKASEKNVTIKLMEVIQSRLAEWSLEIVESDGSKTPMPITVEWIKRLHPMIFIRMINTIVWSIDGGDIEPDATSDEIDKQLDAEVEAIIKKVPVIEHRLEEQRKN